MSIRFKFRSSVAFDSVDLGGRRSISVRDLRNMIVAQKKLQICKDFDLVISDVDTGTVFGDDELQILEGSSVVIKRVPAGQSAPRDLDIGNVERKNGVHAVKITPATSKNVDKENFDDFGVDLYPILQGSLPEFDADVCDLNFTADEMDNVFPRFSETSVSRCQNIESDLSEAMSKEVIGDNCGKECDTREIQKQIKLEAKKEVRQKLDEHIVMPLPTMVDMDLPTELRCSLCNAIFKDAVMIPCCQHSFCEKCIRSALVVRGQCPKCSSMKCTVGALLPNLSLRQAIEHFLEAQAANNALGNKNPQYVPDVESGIHMKEASCVVSIRKREPPCSHSPSATGKGSNLVMPGAAYENKLTSGMGKSAPLPHRMKPMKGDENSSAEALNHISGFPGGHNPSKFCQNFLQEEVNMATQKNKGLGVTVLDGSETLMPSSRHRKGDRTCYMCGSPNHLIRDCPVASNSYPFNQTGDTAFAGCMPVYGQAYWHGNIFPQTTHYGNMYGTQGMMPFDQTMPPISPFGMHPYMSSMYGMPGPYGFMRMGGLQPSMTPGTEKPPTWKAFVEPQEGKHKQKSCPEREHDFNLMPEDHNYKGSRRTSEEWRHQLDGETAGSFSDDDSPRIHKKHPGNKHNGLSHRQPAILLDEELPYVERKHERGSRLSVSGRDQRVRHSDKSNSDVQELSDSSNRHSREKKRHHHEISLKKESDRRAQYASAMNRKCDHRSRKERSDDEKVVADHKKHNHRHHNHSESRFEPSFPGERKQHHKEKEASHSSRSPRQMPKSKDGRLENERWEMVEGLEDEYKGVNSYKHRRTR